MKILAPDSRYLCRVEIGCVVPDPSGTHTCWNMFGYGCMVHPKVVLTSNAVWQAAEKAMHRRGEVLVRIGQTGYACNLGYQDCERNLVALVLAQPAKDADGKPFESFPTVAEEPPHPCQTLGTLVNQSLYSQNNDPLIPVEYLCFVTGSVSLLLGKGESLFGLCGLEAKYAHFGNAVFDEAGAIYGVATDFLNTSPVGGSFGGAQKGILVFTPVYTMAKEAKRLALKDAE